MYYDDEGEVYARRLQHRACRDEETKARRLVRIRRDDHSLGGFMDIPCPRPMEIVALFPGHDGRIRFHSSSTALLRRFRDAGSIQLRTRSRKNRNRRADGIQTQRSANGASNRSLLGPDWNRDSNRGISPGFPVLSNVLL